MWYKKVPFFKKFVPKPDSNKFLTSPLHHTLCWLQAGTLLDIISKYQNPNVNFSNRQVRNNLKAGQPAAIVAKDFSQSSQTCPGEKWTAKAADGKVTVAFSHSLDWTASGVDPKYVDPMTYEIKLADFRPTR